MNSKYKSLIKDTGIFALGSIGSKLILFLLMPLYTNFMTTEEFGTADLVLTLSQLLIPVVSVVIQDAVLRFGMMCDRKEENVLLCGEVVFLMTSAVTVVITPILGLYSPLRPWRWHLCIYILLYTVCQIEFAYLKVENKNRKYAIYSIAETALLCMFSILFLAKLHLGVEGYLASNIMARLLVAVGIFIFEKFSNVLRRAHFDKVLLLQMVAFSAPLVLNKVSWWIIHSSDKIMIEFMLGSVALGLYTVASKIPSLINVIITIFQHAWGISSIREMETSNDTNYYSTVFRMYSFASFGAGVVIIAIIKPFMAVYVGSRFFEAWQYTPLLIVAAVFSSISAYFETFYATLKKTTHSMWTTLACAFINVTANYVLIQRIGVWGALAGTVLSYFLIAHIRMADIKRYVNLRISWRKHIVNVIILLIQAILISKDDHIVTIATASSALFVVNNFEEFLLITRVGGNILKIFGGK